jgi:uncharacterized surface protein with fasciclin (FAS1) repeats
MNNLLKLNFRPLIIKNMKNSFHLSQIFSIRYRIIGITALTILTGGVLNSCNSDNIPSDKYYTFTGETVESYCKKKSELSIFTKLMEDTGTDKLLSCYGHYTAFIPKDSAFQVYFSEKQITYDSLTTAEKKAIVYEHIISNEQTEYYSESFEQGSLPNYNMHNNIMTISFANFNEGNRIFYVNKTAPILQKDITLHNGVIHIVGKVIEPSVEYLLDIMKDQTYFTIFSKALEMTHLDDSILGKYDESYVCPPVSIVGAWKWKSNYPEFKKYGYTVLAETDTAFMEAGITSTDDLEKYAEQYYGTDDRNNYTSRKNALNKFVSYHILNRSMATNSMIYSGKCTVADYEDEKPEYYETFLPYRMIEIKSGNKINFCKDGSYVAIDEFKNNLLGVNGYVHALNNILVYDENVMQNDVLNKRIRYDIFAVAPEFTNNNIRWKCISNACNITPDYCGEYFKFNPISTTYIFGSEGYSDYQADEMCLSGWFDFTLRLLPVPPGTYEVRFGYVQHGTRGISQIYFDDKIIGIPVDLGIDGTDPKVGWIVDSKTEDDGVLNDKEMRNRGYMKGPASILTLGSTSARQNVQCLRVLLGTFTFQEYGYHSFRVKNVSSEDKVFHLDYIEFVPTNYLTNEGRE